jgi:hypothetical protein
MSKHRCMSAASTVGGTATRIDATAHIVLLMSCCAKDGARSCARDSRVLIMARGSSIPSGAMVANAQRLEASTCRAHEDFGQVFISQLRNISVKGKPCQSE